MSTTKRWAGALALMLLSACASRYETIEVDRLAGDARAEVADTGFVVTEGKVVVFAAKPIAGDNHRDYDALDTLELRTIDARVGEVHRGLETGTWMLVGAHAGRTEVEVRINGELEELLSLEVVSPQEGR